MMIEKIVKPEQKIISITRKGLSVEELPQIIGPSFMELGQYIAEQGATILSTPFVSFKNMDEKGQINDSQMEVEIGFPIDRLISGKDHIVVYTLPSYKAVTTHYTGEYENMIPTYIALFEEIKTINGEFLHCYYEYYLSDEEIDASKQETIIELPYK